MPPCRTPQYSNRSSTLEHLTWFCHKASSALAFLEEIRIPLIFFAGPLTQLQLLHLDPCRISQKHICVFASNPFCVLSNGYQIFKTYSIYSGWGFPEEKELNDCLLLWSYKEKYLCPIYRSSSPMIFTHLPAGGTRTYTAYPLHCHGTKESRALPSCSSLAKKKTSSHSIFDELILQSALHDPIN